MHLHLAALAACYFLSSGLTTSTMAASGESPPPFNEYERLKAEHALVEPYLRGIPADPSDYSARDTKVAVLLEAAGEYCRANKVDFEIAFPGMKEDCSVLASGLLPMQEDRFEQPWFILFTTRPGPNSEGPFGVHLVLLHPEGKGPRPRNFEARLAYVPNMKSVYPKGFTRGRSMAWLEGEGREMAVVTFTQGRPYAATHPWYDQMVSKYRVRTTGFGRLWTKSYTLHAVNFVPTHELMRYSGGGQPRIILAKPKQK